MVAIVSGMRAGLDLGSRELLGAAGLQGNALEGRNGQGVYVNVGSGQLVVQNQDELLVARGQDAAALRTYNSSGVLNDDNGDNWGSGVVSLRVSGPVNAAGSSIQRVDRDGSTATYAFDVARNLYLTTEGAGAHDTISLVAADAQFEWRDGGSGATQRFEGTGAYRLLSSRDASGNACTYAYGASGFLSSVTTASGESTFYDYAGANLSQVRTVAGGATTTRVRYGYDGSNRLATVTVDLTPGDNSVADGKVYQTTYGYDGTSKRIATITQSDGTSLAFTYVDLGGGNFKVASVRDALHQASSFSYGAGFTTVTDALGLVTRYDHDASGQLTKITTPPVAGVSSSRQFAYNASGDVVSVTDGEGRAIVFQYDPNGNQVLQRDALGNTVTRTFDARNQQLTETVYRRPDPDGDGAALPGLAATSRNVYDAGGRNLLRFSVSAEGRVTEFRYNGFGEQVTAIVFAAAAYPVAGLAADAALSESQLASWAAGQDPGRTQRTDFAYDGRGQLQSRTTYARVGATGEGIADGSQSVERFVYDAAGLLLQAVTPTNGTATFTYDGLGRTLSRTDALGQVQLTQYDDAGRKTLVTLASGLVTTSAFDAAGRLVSVARSAAATGTLGETRYFYDGGNRLRMTRDPTGVRSWILYDEAGRKTADIDGNGTMVEYAYDRAGQVTRVTSWGTAVNTALLVDAAGLPITTATAATVRPAESTADHGTWRQYDAANRLVREAESWGSGAQASVTETRYDGSSRVVQVVRYANVVPADGSASSVAPGVVPLPAASAQDRSTRHFHDADGRLAGTLDAEGYLTTFRYTEAGQLAERTAFATATDAALRATGTLAQLTPAAGAGDIRAVSLYDGKGRLVAQVDGEGYLTETVHDGNGNATQVLRYANRVAMAVTATSTLATIRPAASAADRVTMRSYDALDRLAQENSPEGVLTQYAYDSTGNLVSTVRAAGSTEVRSLFAHYDVQGRLTGELSAQGAALLAGGQTQAQVDAIWSQYATTYAYDAAGRKTSATDPLGNRTLFFYNADGALTHSVNALGEVQETRYDARGRVSERIVYANRIATTGLVGGLVSSALTTALAAAANPSLDSRTTYTYTRDSLVASTTDAVGTVTTSSYNAFGDEASSLVAGTSLNLLETYAVDRRGLRTGTVRDAAGVNAVSSAVYDAFGRMVRSVDANGRAREQAYDRLGRMVTTRDPLGGARTTSYDAIGRVLTQADALGNVTTYAYDAAARTLKVTTAEGLVSTTTYTRHGQVQSFADARGQVTSYSYDANGQLLQTATPLTTTSSAYDRAGRLAESTDAAGNKVAYSYDAANRVLSRRVDPAGLNQLTTFQYDAKGQRVSVTDPNGVVTGTEYDRKGRVLRQTVDPTGLNLQTLYSYDARGNTLSVRSPAGTVTQYVYDALGRRTQERVDPAGLDLRRSWSYDAAGNVVASTDARGNVTRYAYDANDRLVFTVDPTGSVRQESYDAENRVVRSVIYATPVTVTGLPPAATVAQIQALVVGEAGRDAVEHRVYDRDGRLSATVDGTGAVVKYAYDGNGNVVARIAHAARIDLAAWAAGSVPAPVADSAQDETLRTVYDALNRAAYTVDGAGGVVAIGYDGNGNVVQRTAYATPVAAGTPLTQAGLATAVAAVANPARDATVRNSYDAAGRLAWTVDGTGAVTQRVYDRNGNLVRHVAYANPVAVGASAASVAASANDRSTAMAYDSANRLIFEVDALRAVTEQVRDADGHVVRRVAYANTIASLPTLGTLATEGAIRAAIVPSSGADRVTRYGYDAAGRLALAIDAQGAATETKYDAAGNVTALVAYANLVNAGALPSNAGLAALAALVTVNADADRWNRSAYDAAGRRVYTLDPLGAVTASEYEGTGRVTRRTRYANPVPAATPNTAAAIQAAVTAGANPAIDRVEVLAYNAAGQLLSSTDALGGVESYTYDALGRKMSFVNAKGAAWTYTYDAAGRLLSEASPQVALASATADAAGNISVADSPAAAVVTRLAYDALGNLTQRTEAAGRPEERTTRYEYDAAGRQVRVIFPPVRVYDAATDQVTVNGATGVASRVESAPVTLQARTLYDALGNAVAGIDVADALHQKAYDLLGRVAYEVDALGFVTGYARNAFGEVTKLTRYAAATSLANASVTVAAQAAGKAQVEAALHAVGVDHTKDRVLSTRYDRAGRVIEVVEPEAFVYDPVAEPDKRVGTSGKKTSTVYDAFGQRVQVSVLRNQAANTWATTTSYFDRAGRETATVDALGYLTERSFDAVGNLTEHKEYAAAVTGAWTVAGYVRPAAGSVDDRTTRYTYDRLNRKTAETRVNVEYSTAANGSSVRGDLATTFAYDAVGNQTRVTDAAGHSTYTHFDALGRTTAVVAPTRSSTADGSALSPLTTFRRDAHGNVVVKTEHARGASGTGPAPLAADAADRSTLAVYDSHGHATQARDANGANEFVSYDRNGHVAKKWQGVTGNDGVTRTAFEVNVYDKLGRLLETRTPASTSLYQEGVGISTVSQAQAGVVSTAMEYNAFGELTRKGTQGGRQEYFDYDNAGRLWRTNTGDGVDRIRLYDLQGNVTAEIRSSGSGRDNIDIKTIASAESAHLNPNARRVDIHHDLLGRVTMKEEAARVEAAGSLAVQRQFTSASFQQTSVKNGLLDYTYYNEVTLNWSTLAAWGGGDTQVHLEYRLPPSQDEWGNYYPGALRSYASGVLHGGDTGTGAFLRWSVGSYPAPVAEITRIHVQKVDAGGAWRTVIDQAPGFGGNDLTVSAPVNSQGVPKLQLRAAGSVGDTGWWEAGLVNFGILYRLDASGLAPGSYEYRVTMVAPGQPDRVSATGSVRVTQPPLNNITTPIVFGQSGLPSASLSWAAPGESYAQVLRYRLVGSTGAWGQLDVRRYTDTLDGVDTSVLAYGNYQFELVWTLKSTGMPTAHAIGSMNLVAPQAPYWVPAVNLPPIGGLAGTLMQISETQFIPVVMWNNVHASVAQYRVPGGAWINLAIDRSMASDSGLFGTYGSEFSSMLGIPPGTYEVRVFAGWPPTAQATGYITLYADIPGYWMTHTFWRTTTYVWVAPVPQRPTLTVTTPPYTPGYWAPATPAARYVSVGTTPGTTAISTLAGSAMAQTVATNGELWLRPTVQQKTDRWGNVIEITDPRSAYWKTTYKYNASSQLVQQTQPDAGGGGAPVTSIYYDALGQQVAVKDARGNVNGQVFDAGGNLVQELHADQGVIAHAFNAFGEKVRTIDAMGKAVSYAYDRMGHLLQMHRGVAGVHNVSLANERVHLATRNIVESWSYDQMGRKLSQVNGNGEVLSYTYDLAGNLVATVQPLGQSVRAAFDAQGRKVGEVDANGNAASWTYDYFGQLRRHVDLGGHLYQYAYDNARQLVQQTSTREQSILYVYDAAGQVTAVHDAHNDKTSTYVYDLSGRRIRERVVQQGVTYQDNHLGYDALGNLRDVADARVHITMDYDAVGNRTRVGSSVNYTGLAGWTMSTANRYFQYDSMNRQVVVDAVDATGDIGEQGHLVTYDKNGNRTSDTFWGNKVAYDGQRWIIGYDDFGAAMYSDEGRIFTRTMGYTKEEYRYDALDRLQGVEKDGIQIDVRYYDGAGRVVQSGPAQALPTEYSRLINEGLAPGEMNGKETRINRYDANGRLLHQRVLASDGTWKQDISWDRNVATEISNWPKTETWHADGYDNAGNVLGYIVKDLSGVGNRYRISTERHEGYLATVTHGTSNRLLQGSSTQQYDANGFLKGVTDSTQPQNNRSFVNDANGRALFVNQGGNVRRQMIVNGEVLGIYGIGVNETNPVNGLENNPVFADLVDFDFGYSKITASYPNATPGAYTIRTGDTLQSIAQSAYGDSALWYRIADANGLASNSDLKVGQTLNIPNGVGTIHNNNGTFKPYDPSRIEGDKAPNLPTPVPKKKKHGLLGTLLMVVVAVVVTLYTAGALSGFTGGFFQTMVAGANALGATAATGATLTAAVSATAGSMASQLAGLATGVIEDFDWKGVALSALTAGLSPSVSFTALQRFPVAQAVARSVVVNAIAQGVGVITGLQETFNWRAVAASGLAAGVGRAVGDALGVGGEGFSRQPVGEQIARRFVAGLAAGVVAAAARGGKVAVQQVAVDAFGNALGQSLAESANDATSMVRARFPDADQTFVELNRPAPELPDVASLDALNRQMAMGYEPPMFDPEDSVVVAETETIGLGFKGRTAIIGAPTTTQETLEKVLTEATALRGQYAAAARAQASTDRALRNMQEMADAYRAAGLSGATGDPSDFVYGPSQASVDINDPNLAGNFSNMFAGLPEPAGSGSIKAIEPSLWKQTWGSPEVQHVMSNSITGQILGQIANFIGKGVSAFRSDGYNPATLKHVHGVEKQRALQDTVIGLATLPISGAANAEIGALRAAQAEVAAARTAGAWAGKVRFDATSLTEEQIKIATTKAIRRNLRIPTNADGQLIANVDQTEALLQRLTNWRRSAKAQEPYFLELDASMQGTVIHSSVAKWMRQLDVADVRINRRLYGTSQHISPATGAPYEFRIPDYYHEGGRAILDIKPAGTPLAGPQYQDFRAFAQTNDVRWIYYEGFR